MRRLRYSNDEVDEVSWLVKYHDFDIALTKKSVKRILNKCYSLELFDKLLKLKKSDRDDHINLDPNYSEYINKVKVILDEIVSENLAFSLKQLAINGIDVMGLGYKGKSIGEVLNFVLNAVIDDKVDNNKDELIKYIKEHYQE